MMEELTFDQALSNAELELLWKAVTPAVMKGMQAAKSMATQTLKNAFLGT
jgi:hypothetical protein